MNTKYLLLAVTFLLIGAGCASTDTSAVEETTAALIDVSQAEQAVTALEEAQAVAAQLEERMQDESAMDIDEAATVFAEENKEDFARDIVKVEYTRVAELKDVTGGGATGSALLGSNQEGEYVLNADFEGLPKLQEGYFYEGWLVDKEPFSFISTGATEIIDDTFHMNLYSTTASLEQYDRYVLTLEPDDGDPAPADHIVEADFVLVGQ